MAAELIRYQTEDGVDEATIEDYSIVRTEGQRQVERSVEAGKKTPKGKGGVA